MTEYPKRPMRKRPRPYNNGVEGVVSMKHKWRAPGAVLAILASMGCQQRAPSTPTTGVVQPLATPARQLQLGSSIGCAAFSRDGKTIAVGLLSGEIALVRYSDFVETRRFALTAPRLVSGVSFSADDHFLASFQHTRYIQVTDIASGEMLKKIAMPDDAWLECVAFSPSSQTLCAGGSMSEGAGIVQLFSAETWLLIAEWRAADTKVMKLNHHNPTRVSAVRFSADGSLLAVSMAHVGVVLLNGADLSEVKGLNVEIGQNVCDFDPAKQGILSIANTGVPLWEYRTEAPVTYVERINAELPRLICYSTDGRFLLVGHESILGFSTPISVYSLEGRVAKKVIEFHSKSYQLMQLVISPTSDRLVVGGPGDTLCDWDWKKMIEPRE